VLVVGNAVSTNAIFNTFDKKLNLIKVDTNELKNKLSEERELLAVWIHFDTFLDNSYLSLIKSVPFLMSTTTGLTHISRKIQEHFGSNLISLKNRGELLAKLTSTAEHAWSLIMLGNNNIIKSLSSVNEGYWDRQNNLRKNQLSSNTLGVIGYGRLGKMVAEYGTAFKMEVIVYETNSGAITEAKKHNLKIADSIDEIVSRSDVITIHASFNLGDDPIITQKVLMKIKKPLLIVNTSRGGLVDEAAVIDEISQRPNLRYFTDVLVCEEKGEDFKDSDLWNFSILEERVRITPHIGGASFEAAAICEKELVEDLLKRITK
jgi:D-3-phosphoglycerate dehydrogenase